MKLKLLSFTFLFFAAAGAASAQVNELSTWGAWFHTQKFSEHWGIMFDGQFRSAHHAAYLRNTLLRPSVAYHFSKTKNVSLGYAFIATNGRNAQNEHTYRPEHRIFEQFIVNHKAGTNTNIMHRFRLEQRFQGKTTTQPDVFSQRFRYFVRGVIPVNNNQPVFTKGTFVALQNEAFANVQNKQQINKHVFDQNRAYAAFGYRLSKLMDIEAGYLNQYIKQVETYTINHVAQVAVYTRF